MVTKEFAEASAEISEILSYLPNEYIQKIPKKLRDFFEKVKSKNYISKITPYKVLEEQELKPKTKTLLTIIYRNYWCSEEEKKEIDKILIENDRKYEKELRQKYNPDNIFKNRDNRNVESNNTQNNLPIEIKKDHFFSKIWNFIVNLIKG